MNKNLGALQVDALDVIVEVGSGTLELAHYNAAGSNSRNLTTGYVDGGGTFHDLGATDGTANTVGGGNVLSLAVTVTIKIKPSIVSAGYALATDGVTNVDLATIVTGVNGQNWDITAARTDHYDKQTSYSAGTFYYLNEGVWTTDAAVTNAETFATQAALHDLYFKTADSSRARFFATSAVSGSDAATSVEVYSDQSLALAAGNSYAASKTFYVYIYGGATSAPVSPDSGTFYDGFSVTVSA